MGDAVSNKLLSIVLCLVESNNSCDVKVLEHLEVVFWCISSPLICIHIVERSHESYKLAWNNPIKITIFNLLVVFVFFVVEFFEIVPTQFDGEFESLEAVFDRARVGTVV